MSVFIADFVKQAHIKITYSHAGVETHAKTSIDSIYGFGTQSPTDIQKMVA